jgi:hypothetical protein
LPASVHQTGICCHLITNKTNVKFNADSINTHRKEQQVSLAVFLPSNGDHHYSYVQNHRLAIRVNLTWFVNIVMSTKYSARLKWAFKFYWTFSKAAMCDEKQTTHTAHYLKSLIPAYMELLYIHLIGLHGYVSRTNHTLTS